MSSNGSTVIGVERHRSFPDPPSLETLDERFEQPVRPASERPTVLFTDRPAVGEASVVVTTEPTVVGRAETATPIRWDHVDPPWRFLEAAVSRAVPERRSAADGGSGHWASEARTTDHRVWYADESRLPTTGECTEQLLASLEAPAVALSAEPRRARVVGLNDGFVSLTTGQVVGRPLIELTGRLPDRIVDRVETAVERARADETGPGRETITLTRPDGDRHYVTHDARLETAAGTQTVVVFSDVTELKRRETQTAVLTRILRHDLRNETTVLRGWAERIERLADDDRIAAAAERIVSAATTLGSLGTTAGAVQEVLADRETRWTVHDPTQLVSSAITRVTDRYPEAVVEVDRIEPDRVVGTHHLEDALVELLENAVAHTDAPEACARIEIDQTDESVAVVVADEGPGIPDTDWAVVADRQEITQLNHASGLGLWLVRWIVENNGGWLERTERADGTTVVVHLPQRR